MAAPGFISGTDGMERKTAMSTALLIIMHNLLRMEEETYLAGQVIATPFTDCVDLA